MDGKLEVRDKGKDFKEVKALGPEASQEGGNTMAEKSQAQRDREWEIEDAARTLTRAEEIKANKTLLDAVQKYLAKQQKMIQKAVEARKKG